MGWFDEKCVNCFHFEACSAVDVDGHMDDHDEEHKCKFYIYERMLKRALKNYLKEHKQ